MGMASGEAVETIKEFSMMPAADSLFPAMSAKSDGAPPSANFLLQLPGALEALWFGIGVLQVMLSLRIICMMAGFSKTPFLWFLYGITGLLTTPLRDAVPMTPPLIGGTQFDIAGIVTMAILAVFGWGATIAYMYFELERTWKVPPYVAALGRTLSAQLFRDRNAEVARSL